MGTLFRALPALLGVVAGLVLYWHPVLPIPPAIPVMVLELGLVAFLSARATFNQWPRFASLILNLWEVSAVAVVALCTQIVLWLSLSAAPLLGAADADSAKTGIVLLVGAVVTFFGALWTKDIEKGEGFFFASTQFRQRLAPGFASRFHIASATVESEACNLEAVPSLGIRGWGIVARQSRAGILSEYLQRTQADQAP